MFWKGNIEICFLIYIWYRVAAYLTLCCTMYLICFPKPNSLRFESPSIKLNKMKMPTLLEHVGVGPKLENKHSIELPFSVQTERKQLFSQVVNLRTGSFASLCCRAKKHWTRENFGFCWVRPASQLLPDITIVTCFLLILFSTQKAIHKRRSDNLKQDYLGHW